MKKNIALICLFSLLATVFAVPSSKTLLFSGAKKVSLFVSSRLDSRRMMFIIGITPIASFAGYIPNKSFFTENDLQKSFSYRVVVNPHVGNETVLGVPVFDEYTFFLEKKEKNADVRIYYSKNTQMAQEFAFRRITPFGVTTWNFKNPEYIAKKGEFGDLILRSHSSASLSDLNSFYFIRGNMVVSLKRYDKAFDLEKLAKFIDEKLVNELQKHGIKILQEAPITTPEEVITTYMKKLNIQPKSRAKIKRQADTIKGFLAEKSAQHEYSFKSTKGRRFWRSPDFPNYSFNSLSKTKPGTFFELFYEDSPWDAQYALFYSAIFRTGAITFEQFTNDYRVVKNADDSIILVGKGKSPLYLLHGNFFLKIYTGEKDKLAVAKRIDQEFLSDFLKETRP